MRVSGTSTSKHLERAAPRASFRAPMYSSASWESTALRSSSWRDSEVRPGRTVLANSSVSSGRMRLDADMISTSKMACLPARSLFLSACSGDGDGCGEDGSWWE